MIIIITQQPNKHYDKTSTYDRHADLLCKIFEIHVYHHHNRKRYEECLEVWENMSCSDFLTQQNAHFQTLRVYRAYSKT